MSVSVSLYSKKDNEIYRFLKDFNKDHIENKDALEWKLDIENPIEIADIIGVFMDNNDKYDINMWISLDKDFSINVTDSNVNQIIRYLFERYPY